MVEASVGQLCRSVSGALSTRDAMLADLVSLWRPSRKLQLLLLLLLLLLFFVPMAGSLARC